MKLMELILFGMLTIMMIIILIIVILSNNNNVKPFVKTTSPLLIQNNYDLRNYDRKTEKS